MRSLIYRVLSLGLRFGCPLFILYISSPEVLGSYYLFNTFFTFAVFLISLELAIPFSRSYLKARSVWQKRKVFSSMIINQGILAIALALPLTIFHYFTNPISPIVAIFFFFTLVTGACANETGRFFWNIGQGDHASRRDILNSFAFVIAIALSVFLKKEVLTVFSLGIITLFNLYLLNNELKHWGQGSFFSRAYFQKGNNFKRVFKRIFISLKDSAPQVLHIQILSISPFVERSLIEKMLGLGLVGSYSFQYSLIQSGLSLLLMPMIAKVRRAILSSTTPEEELEVYKMSIFLLVTILVVSLVGVILTHFLVPYIKIIMKKEIISSFFILGAALLSASIATYSNAIAPLYGNKSRSFLANTLTLACMAPMVIFIFDRSGELFPHTLNSVMVLIALTALLQIGIRAWFHFNAILRSPKKLI